MIFSLQAEDNKKAGQPQTENVWDWHFDAGFTLTHLGVAG